jgi:hypothetical protein
MDAHLVRCILHDNGYRPVAIKPGLKFPVEDGWPDLARQNLPWAITDPVARSYPTTGILTDGLRPSDIDLSDQRAAESVAEWCFDNLGDAPIRFRRNSWRMLLLYRAAEGIPPKARVWNADTHEGVEVLGTGFQFVAFGGHPSGYQYEWLGGDPLTIHRNDLTAISEEQVRALLDFAKRYVGEAAVQSRYPNVSMLSQRRFMCDLSYNDIKACLQAIPNDRTDYHWYLQIGYAVFHASGGAVRAFELWRAWSRQNADNDDKKCEGMWRTMHRNPPQRHSAGTLIHFARQADPAFLLPSRLIDYIQPFTKVNFP